MVVFHLHDAMYIQSLSLYPTIFSMTQNDLQNLVNKGILTK